VIYFVSFYGRCPKLSWNCTVALGGNSHGCGLSTECAVCGCSSSIQLSNVESETETTLGRCHPTYGPPSIYFLFLFLSLRSLSPFLLVSKANMDPAKLAKLQAAAAANRLGGKGTPRKKIVRKSKPSGSGDDKKLQAALKKLNVQAVNGIEEVNMFREDGNVLHFSAPKVHAAIPSNTFAIYGTGQVKELTELVPGILNQLGPDSLASLRKLAESYQAIQQSQAARGGVPGGAVAGEAPAGDDDDDDVPDLVESFDVDDAAAAKSNLEEVN